MTDATAIPQYSKEAFIQRLTDARKCEVVALRRRIASWQNEHGWMFRGGCRWAIRENIKRIRAIDHNISLWRNK
jgi:hypothetical protein